MEKPVLNPVEAEPDSPLLDQLPPEEESVRIEENDEWIIAYQVAEEAEARERAKELEQAARRHVLKSARNAIIRQPAARRS